MQKSLVLLLFCLCASCGSHEDKNASSAQSHKARKPTPVTVTQVKNQPVEITEQGIGNLEGLVDPTLNAEIAARVVKVYVTPGQNVHQGQLIATLDPTDFELQGNEAQAEVARIEALLSNQAKVVARNETLVAKKFISQNVLDSDITQQNALKEQLTGAKARVNSISHSKNKTKVLSPVDGIIEKRVVGTGDFVKVGDPIAQVVSNRHLRAHIAFPERLAPQLKAGLKIYLTTPTNEKTITTRVHELKPSIAEGSRSIDVIADVVDAPGWQAGASVKATIVLGEHNAALMVPEQSVVLRPAGEVVYIVKDQIAHQAIVKTGLRQNGLIEITDGLQLEDNIVVDGAGFLTDHAPVKITHPLDTQAR